jgi:hypothetical protein
VALVDPALTITVAGTVATEVFPLARLTDVFADGAAVNVTVPWAVLPPLTLVGFSTSDETLGTVAGGVMLNVAVVAPPLSDAAIVAV